ncbi:MAG TPA: hypothetical protein PLA50_04660 [Bacteroidia bacterium]|nr:hypothetical protein [Bacteroidia bacterium]
MSEPTEPSSLPGPTGSSPASPSNPARRSPGTLFWVFLTLVVAGLAIYFSALHQYRRTLDQIDQTLDTAKTTIVEVAKIFRPEEVVATFHEWRELSVKGGTGSHLEIATAEASERFSRTTNYTVLGKTLPLSTNISEITVPATYRFHIDINDEWQIVPDGKRLLVRAPRIRPTLPVAFDTAKVEKKTSAGWVRWDADTDLADLEKGITEQLGERATRPETLARIGDEGRLAVARFVRGWLTARDAWGEDRIEEIVVTFEGEDASSEVVPKALRIGREELVLP